jgi:hypothetical protein
LAPEKRDANGSGGLTSHARTVLHPEYLNAKGLVGHSSGAHLSLLIAGDPKYLAVHGLSSTDIAGVVGISTPTDLEPRKDGKGFGNSLLGGHGADVFGRDLEVMKDAITASSSHFPAPTKNWIGLRCTP